MRSKRAVTGGLQKVVGETASRLDGRAFESAAVAELLFLGLNCAVPMVDSGIDVLAWKPKRSPIKVQVKGRNFLGHGTGVESYRFSLSSYDEPGTKPDYVLMGLRDIQGGKVAGRNGVSWLVFSSKKFDELRSGEIISERGEHLVANVWAEFDRGRATKVVFQKGYGRPKPGIDMTPYINAWNTIHV